MRFLKPMRKKRWMKSHPSQARSPCILKLLNATPTAAPRPMTENEPRSQ